MRLDLRALPSTSVEYELEILQSIDDTLTNTMLTLNSVNNWNYSQ